MISINTENGTIIYSESSLATIVGLATTETIGVVGMSAKNAAEGLIQLLQKENFSKGVTITQDDNEVSISIDVVVSYGTKFSEVAKNIISTVKYQVESLTELKVQNINVTIQGVRKVD